MLEIPLHDKRVMFVERFQLLQDLIGVVQLAPAALQHFQVREAGTLLLAFLESGAIAFALIAGVRDLKFKPHEKPEADVDLTNLAIATALVTEWAVRVAAGHKWFSPMLLTALTGYLLAFARAKTPNFILVRRHRRRRMLRVDDEGVHARVARRRAWDARWDELQAVEISGGRIRFLLENGKVRELNLRRYLNADEIRDAVVSEIQPRLPRR